MSAPDGYERQKMPELEDVCRKMLKIPPVLTAIEKHTAIVLTCPWGHKIMTVDLNVEADGRTINVRAIADMGRTSGSVAVRDDPFTGTMTICSKPGCGSIVERAGWCEEHGGRDALVIGTLGTRFSCRVCNPAWEDRQPLAVVLQSITVELVRGYPTASVTGKTASAKRRVESTSRRRGKP